MSDATDRGVRFHEVQRLRDTWLPWFVLVSTAVSLVVVVVAVAADGGVRDAGTAAVLAAAVALTVLPVPLAFLVRVETTVEADALAVRVAPFQRTPTRVAAADVVDVRELTDLPGYGSIRVGAALVWPWAAEVHYLVHRDGGVRVERADGRPVVLSSRRAAALARALRAARSGEPVEVVAGGGE